MFNSKKKSFDKVSILKILEIQKRKILEIQKRGILVIKKKYKA